MTPWSFSAARRTLITTLALAPCLAGPAHAQPSVPAWTQVAAGSELRFTITFDNSPASGVFRKFDTALRFDPERLAASRLEVRIAVDTADMTTEDINKEIRKPEWFDSGRFPQAEFRATEIRAATAPGSYVAAGTLTLKGLTHPVQVPFTFKRASDATGETATMNGEFQVDRTLYGIGLGEWRSTRQLSGQVKVNFTVRLRRGP